jgi:phosphate transport system permease protein
MSNETVFDNKLYLLHDDFSYLKKNREPYIKWALFGFASIATLFVFLIIIFLISEGAPFFAAVPLQEFFFGTNWLPDSDFYGAFPIFIDSILVTFGALIIAIPLGIFTAIFIAELAPPLLRKILKFTIEILAGIPSIVYGFFGVLVLNVWIKDIFQLHDGRSWLSGSLILAIMALPTIVSVCEDAIREVPDYYRDASYAMGATKWQTIRRVVIPAGMSGITAAVVLGIGRAMGETMAMTLVLGNKFRLPDPLTNMLSQVAVITSTIALTWGPTAAGSLPQLGLLALAIVLFFMTLLVNTTSNIILNRVQKKFRGDLAVKKHSKLRNLFVSNSFLKKLVKYKQLMATIIISLLIFWIFPDLLSKIIGSGICIGASTLFWGRSKISPKYKQFIDYALGLSFIGWVFSTWIGIFLSVSICLLILVVLTFFRELSTVGQQRFWFGVVYTCSIFAVLMVGIIIFYIVSKGLPVFLEPGFLTGTPKNSGREGGIFPAIIGTLQLTAGSILFALPLGVFAGIYLSEYAKENRITKFIRAGIDNLNGTPSIVFGLFGVVFFIVFIGLTRSILVGSLTLGLMILPTIIRTTEESVKAIPHSFRAGSLALGSSKFQGISKIIIPAAIPGIVTGSVLGMGRSAGETAPILFTAVKSTAQYVSLSIFEPTMALTYNLFRLSNEITGGLERAAGTALTLLLLVLILYSFAFIVRLKYEKKKRW